MSKLSFSLSESLFHVFSFIFRISSPASQLMDVVLSTWDQKSPVGNQLILGPRFLFSLHEAKDSFSLSSVSFFLCKNSTFSLTSSLLINDSIMGLRPWIGLHATMPLPLLLKTLSLIPFLFQQFLHFSAPFKTKLSERAIHTYWCYLLTSSTISPCFWIISISLQPFTLPSLTSVKVTNDSSLSSQ